MDNIYNEEFKEKYLNERFDNEDSRVTVRYIFKKSELIEDILGKDLYDFNVLEIGKVLQNANPHSINVANSYMRVISKYISWCIDPIRIREDNIHPLKGIEKDWANQFVDKTKKIHFSKEELEDIVENKLPNAQDQAFIWMMFEGVQGQKFTELRNLNYNKVNWNKNELSLMDENHSERNIIVSNQCMRYIENAYKEFTYKSPSEKERILVKSDFILRNVESPRIKSPDVSMAALYNRLSHIKQNLDLEYFTGNSIKQSGMIWKAVQIYYRDGYFGDYKQYEEIGIQFNYSMISNNGYNYYNSNLMNQFINQENFKKLYDIDVEF